MKKARVLPGFSLWCSSGLAEHAANHAADERARVPTAAAAAIMTPAPASATAAAMAAGRTIVGGVVAGTGGCRGRHDLGQQGLVLQLVEVAALGIAAGGLPAVDHGAGLF